MEYSTPSTDLYTQVALRTITAGPVYNPPFLLYFLINVRICYDHSGAYTSSLAIGYLRCYTDRQTACLACG